MSGGVHSTGEPCRRATAHRGRWVGSRERGGLMRSTDGKVWTVVACAFLALALAQAASAAPVRSGTIIGGYIPFAFVAPGPGPDCRATPDCWAWAATGCRSQLTGIEPGLFSSIVDVSDLAGAEIDRDFTIEAVGTDLLVFGGVSVEFWSGTCQQLAKHGGEHPICCDGITRGARFRVPAGSRWMTVASVDSTSMRWYLS